MATRMTQLGMVMEENGTASYVAFMRDDLARYEQALAGAYPMLPDGTVLLPFPRLFFIAQRD